MASEQQTREQYLAWKRLVPYLYDFFTNHNLTWPSLSCRWGPEVESSGDRRKQRLYLSEQTDGSEPNKLLVVTADIPRPRVAAAEALTCWNETGKSQFLSKPSKTLFHPGEVNKIKELPSSQSVVVTHTDAPQLYVWDLEKQADRAGDKGASARHASVADLVLEGHQDNAEFALGISTTQQPRVASGGKDSLVLVWDIASHVTSLATPPAGDGGPAASPPSSASRKRPPTLRPQQRLEGHSATVEDVVFLPGSGEQLASVGDDFALLLWDTRAGKAPVLRIAGAHGAHDVHCVDWSQQREDLLVTGAADGSVKVWDRRSPAAAGFSFRHHSEATMRVEWSPHRAGVFASAGDDRLVCIWDLGARAAEGGSDGSRKPKAPVPAQLMFQHAGHRAPLVDLQWNPSDPWSLMSVSDDAKEGGGGTLQLWRVSDLIYRPDDEVLAELEQYRDYIVSGNEAKLPAPSQQTTQRPADSAGVSHQAQQAQHRANGSTLGQQPQREATPEIATAAPVAATRAPVALQVAAVLPAAASAPALPAMELLQQQAAEQAQAQQQQQQQQHEQPPKDMEVL